MSIGIVLHQRDDGMLDAAGPFEALGAAKARLVAEHPDQPHFVVGRITLVVERAPNVADPRQGWLNLGLPQYGHVLVTGGETLDQYRVDTERLAKRIESYTYARRSDSKLKRDKLELRERQKLDKKVAPLFAGDPAMTMSRAVELYRASLETPIAARNRMLAKKGAKARWARTKNQ